MIAEAQRQKRAEERKRKEDEARWRAEAERLMTPWERILYCANVGDRRFERYRRP